MFSTDDGAYLDIDSAENAASILAIKSLFPDRNVNDFNPFDGSSTDNENNVEIVEKALEIVKRCRGGITLDILEKLCCGVRYF